MIARFLKDSSIYSVSLIISKGITFFLLPLYTKVLSPESYGIIDLLSAYTSISVAFFGLQLTQAVARHLPEFHTEIEKRECASTAFIYNAFIFGAVFLFNIFVAFPVSRILLGSGNYNFAFRLNSLLIFITALLDVTQSQLRWDLKTKEYSFVSVMIVLATIGSTLAFLLLMHLDLIGVILGQLVGSFVGLSLSFYLSKERFFSGFSLNMFKPMALFSMPLVPASLTVVAWTYVDRFFIRSLMTLQDVGIYGIALRFASLVMLVLNGFNLSLTPLIYSEYKSQETPKKIAFLFSFFIAAMLILIVGAFFFSKEVVKWMVDARYFEAARVIPFLVCGVILAQLYNFAPGITIAKKTLLVLMVNVLVFIVSLFGNYLLVPVFGIIGSAYVNVCNGIILLSWYMLWGQRYYPIPYDFKKVILLLIVAISSLILRLFFGKFDFFSGVFEVIIESALLIIIAGIFIIILKCRKAQQKIMERA